MKEKTVKLIIQGCLSLILAGGSIYLLANPDLGQTGTAKMILSGLLGYWLR